MKSNERRTTSTLLVPGCQPGTDTMIDEEEAEEELHIEQASLSRHSIALPVPAPVVVVTVSLYGTQQSHYQGYQDQNT